MRRNYYKTDEPAEKGEIWLERFSDRKFHRDDYYARETFMKHPFGLPMFKSHHRNSLPLPIHFLRTIHGYLLVDTMADVVSRELKYNDDVPEQPPLHGLRVIYTEIFHNPDHHRIFYEAAGLRAAYLVGHSTDYSGHGGECHEHLSNLFIYLAKRYNLEIEKVVLSYGQSVRGLKLTRHPH